MYHLFLRCNFAKKCWRTIGVAAPRMNCSQRAATIIIRQLDVQGALEILVLMTWSIWKCVTGGFFKTLPKYYKVHSSPVPRTQVASARSKLVFLSEFFIAERLAGGRHLFGIALHLGVII
jgi:hypothetical protein